MSEKLVFQVNLINDKESHPVDNRVEVYFLTHQTRKVLLPIVLSSLSDLPTHSAVDVFVDPRSGDKSIEANSSATRYHNADFRYALYAEYDQIIRQWYKENMDKMKADQPHDSFPQALVKYGAMLKKGEALPYPHTENKERENKRLEWVATLLMSRRDRYKSAGVKPDYLFATSVEEFMGDVYYSMYTDRPQSDTYMAYRYSEELRKIHPSVEKLIPKIKMAIHKELIKTKESVSSRVRKMVPEKFSEQAFQCTVWMMDLYICMYLLRGACSVLPYVMVLGDGRLESIKRWMGSLGISFWKSVEEKEVYHDTD